MMGKQHLQFATITAIGSYALFYEFYPEVRNIMVSTCYIGGALLGSLLPDIDKETSTIGQCFFLIPKIISKLFGHRTITHDILLWTIVAMISTYHYPLLFGFWLGYLGHLFLDAFTKEGIIWGYFFHPRIKKDKYYGSFKNGYFYLLPKCMRFYANSRTAKVFTIFMSFLIVYGMYLYVYHNPIEMLMAML